MGLAVMRQGETGQTSSRRSIFSEILRLLVLAVFVLFAHASPSGAQETVEGVKPIEGFDHGEFGIPLTGAHAKIICESCHIDNKLAGTPRDCAGCHNGTIAKGKPASHPPAGNQCTQCHTTRNFVPFAFDHTNINQACATCHNGASAKGKPANHIPATDTCDDCHVTTNMKEVRVDHDDVKGTCISCHNGKTAPGKPKDHVAAPNDCASCHSTLQFAGAVVDHSFIDQPCASCHNGVTAIGKPVNHMPAPETCGDCHTPFFEATFASVNFDHSIVAGDCASCHIAGGTWGAPSPPDWHLGLDLSDCGSCHVPGGSFTSAQMDHAGISAGDNCASCHVGGSPSGAPPPPDWHLFADMTDCGSCHVPGGSFAGAVMDHSVVTGSADCSNCHSVGSPSGAPPPPPWHSVVDMTDCDTCHIAGVSFSGALMDHSRATPNVDCVTCHFSFASNPPPDPNLSTRVHSSADDCASCH